MTDSSRASQRPSSASSPGAPCPDDGPDADLVRACLSGTPGSWDAFVERFAGLFHHVVDRTSLRRHRPLSAGDRDDIVAEILFEVLKGDAAVLRGFAGRSSLATYLAVIARRTAVRMLLQSAPAPAEAAPAAVDPVDRRAEKRRADREEVEALLVHLAPEEATLVRLHHLEARSYGEISRITGLPLGSIGPALSRARQKMRGARAPESGAGPKAAG